MGWISEHIQDAGYGGFLAFLLLSGCQAAEELPRPLTKADYLIGKDWALASVQVDPGFERGPDIITDLLPYYEACRRDNSWRFEATGQFCFDEGTSRCTAYDPQRIAGHWALTTDERKLVLTVHDDNVVLNLGAVTSQRLQLLSTLREDGEVYTVTETYLPR
ncbi:hypothetical protein HER32_11420 [Hymenobacter sp. BT18]|uniref:hypothetical protein n=1 Tax=Hymenobacter sp. BT18 TaxID=2835648 RepID=UPI00143E28D8|nr:hypothetical protein [Hymenobacter sp. BT18]QIX61753.1 hypothetical protein HER32_11420 [Hymenobacter sp. BT18]